MCADGSVEETEHVAMFTSELQSRNDTFAAHLSHLQMQSNHLYLITIICLLCGVFQAYDSDFTSIFPQFLSKVC